MNNLVLFEEQQVRRVWHDEAWWFVISDVVAVLTDSVQYLKRIRQRDPQLNEVLKGGVSVPLAFWRWGKQAGRMFYFCHTD